MIASTQYGPVTVLTIDRPERRNALTIELCHGLRSGVRDAVDGGARVLVLTGAGTSFCSGADLDAVYSEAFRAALYELLHTVAGAPIPVLAAVNGPAIGAGTQLAIAADLRVAAPTARFGVPTAKLGLAVDPWTIRRLALLAGHGTARRLLLACEQLEVDAARVCGLVDRVGDGADALSWAVELAALAPLTIAYSKRGLRELFEPELVNPGLEAAFQGCWASEDFAEGRRSRVEKRPPVFRGR
ncbi:MAG: enoyl-CoA hydratase [Geodermatophilaceae bacterium]|nr:enoyl-CoA hydratase [Geodermatophilaceae bacterium]